MFRLSLNATAGRTLKSTVAQATKKNGTTFVRQRHPLRPSLSGARPDGAAKPTALQPKPAQLLPPAVKCSRALVPTSGVVAAARPNIVAAKYPSTVSLIQDQSRSKRLLGSPRILGRMSNPNPFSSNASTSVLDSSALPESVLQPQPQPRAQQQQQQQQHVRPVSPPTLLPLTPSLPLPHKAAAVGVSTDRLISNVNSTGRQTGPRASADSMNTNVSMTVATDRSNHSDGGHRGVSVAPRQQNENLALDQQSVSNAKPQPQPQLDWLDTLVMGANDDKDDDDDDAAQDIDAIISALEGGDTDGSASVGSSSASSSSSSRVSSSRVSSSYGLMAQMLVQSQQLALSAMSDYHQSSQSRSSLAMHDGQKTTKRKVSSGKYDGNGTKKRRLRKNKHGVIPIPNEAKRRVALARRRVNGRFVSSNRN
jgi:hypothetical protein